MQEASQGSHKRWPYWEAAQEAAPAPAPSVTKRTNIYSQTRLHGVAEDDFCKKKQMAQAIRGWQQGKDLPAEDVNIVVHASGGYHTGVCGVHVDGQDATL